MYFRDKSVFFASLIAPLILLFLYIAFLGNNYSENLRNIAETNFGIALKKSIVSAFAGGWLLSSLIAVCAVSIAFTANMVMVQDKVTGRIDDFNVSPVPKSYLALGYYISTALVTLAICFTALFAGFIYLGIVGWYLSVADVFLLILDTFLLVMFGTALSGVRFFVRRVYSDRLACKGGRSRTEIPSRYLRYRTSARALYGQSDRGYARRRRTQRYDTLFLRL